MITTTRFTTILAAGFAASFAIALTPMAAHAAAVPSNDAAVERVEMDDDGVPHLRVSYAGLDLNSASDRAEMNRRLATAATRVCTNLRISSISTDQQTDYENCRAEAIARGHASIDGIAAH